MAILESCCFWKNVRNGSFAAAFYTLTYFGFSTVMLFFYLKDEQEFLLGRREQPLGESILEKGDVTVVTVIFNILFLFCSVLMMLSSILLIVGLRHNKRQFLLPWILFMLCDLLIECGHLLHLTVSKRVVFDPIVGFIFTIDFFILCLNLYCLLCVISQYQEYRDQRAEEALPVSLAVPTKPIVIVTAPQKTKKSQTLKAPEGKTRQTRRLLAASPLITSQRLTNFSTITEEEEQQIKCKKIAASSGAAALSDTTEVRVGVGANAEKEGHGINGSCEQLSENPSPQEPDEGVNAGIPIIISEPSSLP